MTSLPRKLTVFFAVAVWLLATASLDAADRKSKLDKALRDAARHPAMSQRVIIQTRPGARAALKRSLQAHGDVIEAEHPSIDALTVNLHGADLAALEANPHVLAVSIDAEVTTLGARAKRREAKYDARAAAREAKADAKARGSILKNVKKNGAVDLLRRSLGVDVLPMTGSGISVAVVDSGIEANRDLAGNIAGFWDFTRGGAATKPYDDYGHGTHVAGLIASTGAESKKEFMGVAPSTRLYGFKVLDNKGRGRASDVVKALEFIVANKKSSDPDAIKVDVINLSLGHPIFEPAATDPLVMAVEHAVRAGIVVVTAAGNVGQDESGTPGYAGILSPGNAPSAITVGASDNKLTESIADDRVAYFSSRGPSWFDGYAKPDLLAPGVGLVSDAARAATLFTMYPELKKSAAKGGDDFAKLSGTSMAAAVATGVVSLVLEASRSVNHEGTLTPNALKAVMQFTAVPLRNEDGLGYDALTQGTGTINTRGAVAMALAINTAMPVGSHWLRLPVPPVSLIAGLPVRWSQALIWDDNIVWGTEALSFNAEQWGDNIVWGTAYGFDGDNIVWGTGFACGGCDNIVWGTAADLDNIVWGTVIDLDNIVWGTLFDGDNIVWGTSLWAGNIVWGNRVVGQMLSDGDNIVWGTLFGLSSDNIVWGTLDGDNIVWGTFFGGDNIVWGTTLREAVDNIVWGTLFGDAGDNIVWGTRFRDAGDNIVWGTLLRGDR
jgi:serine protease AprX